MIDREDHAFMTEMEHVPTTTFIHSCSNAESLGGVGGRP
jgi:hypothetical protein